MPRLPLIVSLVLIGLALAASAWLYPALPDQIPTHWNIRGEADGFGPKAIAAWILPVVALGLLAFLRAVPWLSPRDFRVDVHGRAFGLLVVTMTALFVFIHFLSLAAALRPGLAVDRALVAGVLLCLGAIGFSFDGLERNFFMGIRVPWTIASDRVWNDTHRLAARIWPAGGIAGAVLAACGFTVAAFCMLVPMVAVPIVYSFIRSKQLEREGA